MPGLIRLLTRQWPVRIQGKREETHDISPTTAPAPMILMRVTDAPCGAIHQPKRRADHGTSQLSRVTLTTLPMNNASQNGIPWPTSRQFGTVRLILETWTTGYSIPSPALERLRGPAMGRRSRIRKVSRRGAAIPRRVSDHHLRLILSSFVEPHFLHASVRSSNFQPSRIGLIRIMTISVPQSGHADPPTSGGVSGVATCFPFAEASATETLKVPIAVLKGGPDACGESISVILRWGPADQNGRPAASFALKLRHNADAPHGKRRVAADFRPTAPAAHT